MIELPPLPYAENALEPVISERTMQFHYGKHHATYVKTTNTLAEQAGLSDLGLDDLVIKAASTRPDGAPAYKTLYNNAAQVWNHTFFWNSMTPSGEHCSGVIARLIDRDLGGFDAFKAQFIKTGTGQFGSGWVWLVLRQGVLELISTHDAANFLTDKSVTPLLVCDVWEHAYYLDHQNNRAGFLEAWIDKLANWSFAQAQLDAVGAEHLTPAQ